MENVPYEERINHAERRELQDAATAILREAGLEWDGRPRSPNHSMQYREHLLTQTGAYCSWRRK